MYKLLYIFTIKLQTYTKQTLNIPTMQFNIPKPKIAVDICLRNVIEKDISAHKILTPIEVTKYLTDKSQLEALKKFNNK